LFELVANCEDVRAAVTVSLVMRVPFLAPKNCGEMPEVSGQCAGYREYL